MSKFLLLIVFFAGIPFAMFYIFSCLLERHGREKEKEAKHNADGIA